MTRVQIPAYTDRWVMGDRYGEIVKIVKSKRRVLRRTSEGGGFTTQVREIAIVKLDKSGHHARVLLADCEVVS